MGVVLTDEQLEGRVVAGVDTHADTHWLCVLDELRRVAMSAEFPAGRAWASATSCRAQTTRPLEGAASSPMALRARGRRSIASRRASNAV